MLTYFSKENLVFRFGFVVCNPRDPRDWQKAYLCIFRRHTNKICGAKIECLGLIYLLDFQIKTSERGLETLIPADVKCGMQNVFK